MKTNGSSRSSLGPQALQAVASVRARIENDFASLKAQQPRVLQLALNEAEALAWQSGFPQLVFPTLAREKACKVAGWHRRQQSLRPNVPATSFAA